MVFANAYAHSISSLIVSHEPDRESTGCLRALQSDGVTFKLSIRSTPQMVALHFSPPGAAVRSNAQAVVRVRVHVGQSARSLRFTPSSLSCAAVALPCRGSVRNLTRRRTRSLLALRTRTPRRSGTPPTKTAAAAAGTFTAARTPPAAASESAVARTRRTCRLVAMTTTVRVGPLRYRNAPLHCAALRCTHCAAHLCTHCSAPTALTALHCTHCGALHPLRCDALHCTAPHYTAPTASRRTALHCTALHRTAPLHSQRRTALR